MGDNRSHLYKRTQHRFIIGTLILAAIVLVIAVPLIINGDLRLRVAYRLALAPGGDAVQIATADDNMTLVVLPLEAGPNMVADRFRYKAQYLAAPGVDGTVLTEIDSSRAFTIPLKGIDFIAADPQGAHVLFRGTGLDGHPAAVLVDVAARTSSTLPSGQTAPDLPGNWQTPVWDEVTGRCDRFSVSGKYIACFKRAKLASYFAGDWQIDVQLNGDFRKSTPVYRGAGFLPIFGWAKDDTELYIQNERGIWRIAVPLDKLTGS